MKKILLFIITIAFVNLAISQDISRKELNEIKTFFDSIEVYALSKDAISLKMLIDRSFVDNKNNRNIIIENILKNNHEDKSTYGFSVKAVQYLKDSSLYNFDLISKDLFEKLKGRELSQEFKELTPKDVYYFEKSNGEESSNSSTRVLLVRREGKIKLLIWQNLNNLIR